MVSTQPLPRPNAAARKGSMRNVQQVLRPILRDIAQSILVCYFVYAGTESSASREQHQKLLAQLVAECENVQKGEMS
eukprot:CAMPEP_0185617886 /NCGR_PEP_ID=MMETSP0436-20130131/45074_1 /TAXON_ID=626734 ORGANISM="Favella taraikaensis, Strain Fe Narragansett Bay" /NCGR_SAMPLE_ID=MMETSP0436 /ASSEMBLY_ACC=CAM_ASM_000390 /LENGTH=76 /DNA_ID=CAMNT_0028255961 /DNA_START=1048 /DNA_END=1278 /DNA_ORIENTATION=-